MSTTTHPVLIVGSGPTGLAAALALAKSEVPVRIVSKATRFHQMSRGSGIHARTLEVFHFLGVLDDIQRNATPLRPFRSYKMPGGRDVERSWNIFEPADPTPDRPYGALTVDQYLTEGILRDHLASCGVQVELGTEPVSLKEDSEAVTVTLKKTDVNGEETTEIFLASYVIGGDGARGMTRKAIGATFEGQTKDADGGVWADCVLEGEGLDPEIRHLWSLPGKVTVTARPKVHGGFHVGIVGKNFDPIRLQLEEHEKFIDYFHKITGRDDIVFKEITELMYWRPNMRMVNKLSEGRIFIAGDAAHVHSPTGGQGLNTSVQDSFNLAWKIALAYKGIASPALLASYNTERLPVVAQMLFTTTNLYTNVVAKTAQDAQASQTTTTGGDGFLEWKNRALSQLDVNYRYSPVVLDARGNEGRSEDDMKALAYQGYGAGASLRAGDRAPQAPGLVDQEGNTTTLFDVFKVTSHTILLFLSGASGEDGKVAEVIKMAQGYPTGAVQVVLIDNKAVPPVSGAAAYQDRDGHAVRVYKSDVAAPTVVVVRPDGYIGAFVNNASGVHEYFSKVFCDV